MSDAKLGRPPIPISSEKLEGMLIYGATLWECAAEFDCSEDTIENFVMAQYGILFSDLRAKHFGKTQLRLKQAQIRSALGGTIRKTYFNKVRKVDRKTGVTTDELIPKHVDIEVPPNVIMQMWLGKQLLGQSEDAREQREIEQLRERFERPVIQIEVQDSEGNKIDTLEQRWSDQYEPINPKNLNLEKPRESSHAPKIPEEPVIDVVETDSNDQS